MQKHDEQYMPGVQTYRIIQWQQLNPVVLVHEEMREMKRNSIVQAYAHVWKLRCISD